MVLVGPAAELHPFEGPGGDVRAAGRGDGDKDARSGADPIW
jgi:hypothetical protein